MRSNGVQVLAVGGVESVAPVSATTVYSDKFELTNVIKIGLELIATSGGTPNVLVNLVVSQDDANYDIDDGYSAIINITDETRHKKSIYDTSIPAARYGKLEFIGQGANPSDTVITGFINLIRDQR